MREIMFRGIRVDTGKWVYGDLRREGQRTTITDVAGNSFEVEAESVGQFTGLFDANGIRIFEGDTIQSFKLNPSRRDFTGVVQWSSLFCSWVVDSYIPLYGQIEQYQLVVGEVFDKKEE
jgi:uncharacterized phage protein (TIGR01671 family)